jgi:PIN domain nuclease of toxin-antitoxin system
LLIDSQTLIWAADDVSQLSPTATTALQDPANDLLLSATTVWEIAIKWGLGKPPLSMPYRDWLNRAITDLGLSILPITVEYAHVQAGLPRHRADPFDRLMIAQALVEGVPIVRVDSAGADERRTNLRNCR